MTKKRAAEEMDDGPLEGGKNQIELAAEDVDAAQGDGVEEEEEAPVRRSAVLRFKGGVVALEEIRHAGKMVAEEFLGELPAGPHREAALEAWEVVLTLARRAVPVTGNPLLTDEYKARLEDESKTVARDLKLAVPR